jgi:hypothetical protein
VAERKRCDFNSEKGYLESYSLGARDMHMMPNIWALVYPWNIPERLSHQAIDEAAYFRWLSRNRPIGDPLTDWLAAEAEAYGLALRWFNLSVSWWSEWIKLPWPV